MDLESLWNEMDEYLAASGLAVFYGFAVNTEEDCVYWDERRKPGFREFVESARKAGVRIVVADRRNFLQTEIDDLRERIEDLEIPPDRTRSIESRVTELQKFEGFTCKIELSFCVDNRCYVHQTVAEWYKQWEELFDEITWLESAEDEFDSDGDDGMSGYYSAN